LEQPASKVTLGDVWANRDMEEPQQGLDPAGKHQQGEPQSMPGIVNQGTNLGILGGIVLMDMVKALEKREEAIPRRIRRIVVRIVRGNDGSRVKTRESKIHQMRNRLNGLNPKDRRR
jgi:hypothetical protein